VKGPLPDDVFYGIAVAWFAIIAIIPRGVILVLTLGKNRISDTGVRVLRVMAVFFAAWAAIDLAIALSR
jgi:hypothetical protein